MQSGKIKHWNADKGYGFIDVDNQSEDVFFHISTVRLPKPISEGQRVYFNSERNDKNQLRATEVTSNELSILETSESTSSVSNSTKQAAKNTNRNDSRHSRTGYRSKGNHSRPKKSGFSTLFSVIAIIAAAIYFFADLKSIFFADSTQTTTISQTSSEPISRSNTAFITGDAQIDQTIALIRQGGPFPYPYKDGTTFYNREGKLPAQSKGYYREYTVPTPGVANRGARRIVTGGHPPTFYYLTIDHYDSFKKLQVN